MRITLTRRLAMFAVCVVLGALSTFAVSWACAEWVRVNTYHIYAQGVTAASSSGWYLSAARRPGAWYVEGVPVAEYTERWGAEELTHVLDASEVDWPNVFETVPDQNGYLHTRFMSARGWPMPALGCDVTTGVKTHVGVLKPEVSGAIVHELDLASGSWTVMDDELVALPLRVMWPGFAVDTAVFGSAWGVLIVSCRWLRRRVRLLTRRSAVALTMACAVLGVISTIVVTFVCVLFIDYDRDRYGSEDGYGQSAGTMGNVGVWWASRSGEAGAVRFGSWWIERGKGFGGSGPGPSGPAEAYLPAWTDYLDPTWDDDAVSRAVDARGWPMLAMWGGFETRRGVGGDINRSEVVDTTNAVFLPRYAEGALLSGWSTMIPLAPIWPGFAVNSAIFGAAWGVVTLIVLGPGVIVRTRRNARSACFACGYPVGSSTVCTECGQVLKTRMSASA